MKAIRDWEELGAQVRLIRMICILKLQLIEILQFQECCSSIEIVEELVFKLESKIVTFLFQER
jgi:hypothetical protein